jgi:hypothetical protein
MLRRLSAFVIGLLMISAATSEFYNLSNKNVLPLQLRFATSYVAMDPFDDLSDTPYPAGIVSGSPRANTIIKLMLSASVRTFRFEPRMTVLFERPPRSRLTSQDLFRLEKVFRI